ncbi:hypothetical protein EZV62_008297 [Acer yangbiense]|uniref:AAA+ ATPase domain-containing protein n=1 Tax=Acer yangbiense TaxID=1000413 RepID=A0A5C7IDR1_9ROSI|nr:hypothetical protein EZV62_008297 [Acer yangbiense]
MEFASSILSSILSKIGEYLVDSSIHQANYLLRFKNYVDDLKREDENLRSTQHRVQHDVERAKRNTEEIEKDVEKWLMDVQNVLEEIQRLEDEMQVKKTFLCGQCPNWGCRYKLSKRAVKKMSEMAKLRESGKFDRLSYSTTLPGVEGPKDFISFKPTEYASSQIMEALKNDTINMIGLYGMGGVGKTTLAKVVGKEAKEKKLFDEVVMVTVSQNPDVKNLQTHIADFLGLKFEEETIEVRAQRLCLRLKKEKKILIILDDVWRILDLTTIGIPFGDDHKGCTILLTTREQQVCISMRCQSRIRLGILNEEEGLILFRKHAGIYNINDSPTLNDVVKEVVGECGGLPIAIVTIGSALREKPIDEWKFVVKKLKLSKLVDIETVDQNMKALKVASLRWVDLSVKSLQFLTNLVTLQLIQCRVSDISSIKKLAQVEILSLKGSEIVELPEELGELSKLRMLDITDCRKLKRIPANVIPRLSRLEELYIGSYNCFEAWEVEGTSVEQSNASLSELSKLDCLTILSLCINVQPLLPKDFVLPTKSLRYCVTVNCGYMEESYPKSRILKIRGIEATSLVAFKALCEKSGVEYLELREIEGCCQNMVPSIDETGLNELKRLTLWSFDELECIVDTMQQQDVAFSNLVDLSLQSVGLREICSGGRPPRGFLENLETIKISSCARMSNSLFPSWVLIQRLRKLKKVTVGWCGELEDVFQLEGLCYSKENPFLLSSLESLHLSGLQNLRYIWKGPTQQVSLQSLTFVRVDGCNKLRYLFTLSLARSLLQLEVLIVWGCDSLEHVVQIKEVEENVDGGGGNDVMFPKLRILQLLGIENFINFYSENSSVNMQTAKEQLWDVNLLRHGLQNLEVLKIGGCKVQVLFQLEGVEQELSFPSLKQLRGLRHGLQNLEELYIKRCGVQVLFHLEGLEQELTFPSLKELKLYDLEELEYLCKGPTHLLSLSNLKKLSVYSCNRLRHMFSPSLARNFMQLEELIISWCGELEQIFIEDDAEYYLHWPLLFPSLSRVDIMRCNKLKSMFPVSIAHLLSLQNLTTLQLDHCHGLTHLFSSTTLVRNLLQLKTIDIKDCWELEQIIVEEHIEDDHVQLGLFPNLSSISVYGCGKLKTLFPAVTIARSGLQKLNILEVGYCKELEQIIVEDHTEDDHVQLGLFPNLSSISIDGCGKLKTLFPIVTIKTLQKLKTINIGGSFQLEELFGHKDEANMTSRIEMVLPQLQKLTLAELASLINFCPIGCHFIFPSLSELLVTKCPKLTTRFSVDQNRSVHAEAKAPQTGKEGVDMEQSAPETTRETICWGPPYIGK